MFRTAKYYFLLFVRKEDSPERIAHGFAMGIFIGFIPIIPFQTISIIMICTFFKTNKLAGILGSTAITNPLLAMPVFYGQHFLGRIVIPKDFSYSSFLRLFTEFSFANINEIGSELLTLFKMVLFGGVIAGIITYPVFYYLVKSYIIRFREKALARRLKKRLKEAEKKLQ